MGLLEDVAGKYGKDSNWNALRSRTDDPLLQQLTSQYGTFAAGSDGMPNWNALRNMVSATPRPQSAMTPQPPQQPAAGATPAPTLSAGTGQSTAASITPADVAKPAAAGGSGGATTNNAATSIVAMQNASPSPATTPIEAPGALRSGLGNRMPPQYGSALAALLRTRTYGTIV